MNRPSLPQSRLSHADLLELRRWNTPTVYNGWEQITRRNAGRECFNLEAITDYMPEMGPMVGYAITLVIQPGNREHAERNSNAWAEYRAYVASMPGPTIAMVQDLDKPQLYGAAWGEVNSSIHRALGCVGAIVDGGVRDVGDVRAAGFKVIARRTCIGHAFACPVRWDCEVEVFGCAVRPGQLVHADEHGFLVVPKDDETHLLAAARFMDSNECQTMIPAARGSAGKTVKDILATFDQAAAEFGRKAREKFGRRGEW